MTHAMLSNAALLEQMTQDPRYKELALEFQAKAQAALTNTKFTIETLGGMELTLPEVAQAYQSNKSLGAWFFPSEEARKASFAYAVSQECLAVIKKAGYKADAESIKSIIAHA